MSTNDEIAKCCSHNAVCAWAVGSEHPGQVPNDHVQHFATWTEAFEHFADRAYNGGVTNDYIESVRDPNSQQTCALNDGQVLFLLKLTD